MNTSDMVREIDVVEVVLALVIVGTGLVFLASSSYTETSPSPYALVGKQVTWTVISLIAFVAVLVPSYRLYWKYAYHLFVLSLVLLAAVHVPFIGLEVHGARRWIPLGFMNFQPSEFAKVAFILALAKYLTFRESYRRFWGLAAPFALTLVPMGLVLTEPDLGTSLVFAQVLFALLYVAGAKRKHLAAIVLAAVVAFPVFFAVLMGAHQKARIHGFLFPRGCPDGSSSPIASRFHDFAFGRMGEPGSVRRVHQENWHGIQSEVAIGSGRLFGRGLGEGPQTAYGRVPESDTDFIFSVVGEEAGFVGCVFVLVVYALLFAAALGVASRTREPFGRLVVVGVVSLLASQVIINTGMTVGLMPITGLPLPFFSYGGSSLLSSFVALGLVVNVGMRRLPVLADEDFK